MPPPPLRHAVTKKVIRIVSQGFLCFQASLYVGGFDDTPEYAEVAYGSMHVAQRDSTQRHARGCGCQVVSVRWRCGIHAAAQRQIGRVGFAAPGHVTPGRVLPSITAVPADSRSSARTYKLPIPASRFGRRNFATNFLSSS